MAITGVPTGIGDDLVIVTPTGQHSANGEGGTDTLRVDYRTLRLESPSAEVQGHGRGPKPPPPGSSSTRLSPAGMM